MTKSLKLGIIKSRWHADIVDQAQVGLEAKLNEEAVPYTLDVVDVPGALEMPLVAQRMAKAQAYDAIICAAFVVDGGIYRHDFVAQAVVDGIVKAGMATDTPVLSVSLTPHNFQETPDHLTFFHNHMAKKGAEAAEAAIIMAKI